MNDKCGNNGNARYIYIYEPENINIIKEIGL